MPSSARPTVSVIIPVYKGGENLRRCLLAVTGADPPPHEIIVVVDGGAESLEWLAKGSGLQVLSTPTRGGPARARNLGARIARGDLLFFVDADVVLYPDAIDQVVVTFSDEPSLAAVFGSYDVRQTRPVFFPSKLVVLIAVPPPYASEGSMAQLPQSGQTRGDTAL